MQDLLKGTWNDQFARYLILAMVVLAAFVAFMPAQEAPSTEQADMTFFFLPTCPHCHDQMEFHETLLEDYPGLTIRSVDVSSQSGQSEYVQALTAAGQTPDSIRTPVTIINDTVITGFDSADTTGELIRDALDGHGVSADTYKCGSEEDCDAPLAVSIFGYDFSITPADFSLPILAIVLGLIDGFNPCAMWVLVYLISLVMVLKDKRRAWMLVGIFLAASGILYFLFLTAWLNVFLVIGFLRPVQVLIGAFALGVGIYNLKEWWDSKGRVICKVGDAKSKKKTIKRAHDLVNAPLTIASIFGIIVLAFVINSVEFMCSFGIPAVFAEVLAVSPISLLGKYGLILVYVFMYMIDDLIIFGLAVFAVDKALGDKYASHCKLIAGVLLALLGFVLLFIPGLLAAVG